MKRKLLSKLNDFSNKTSETVDEIFLYSISIFQHEYRNEPL